MDRTAALLDWYGRRRRDFPWRRTRDPWAILSVEVMSQQTQIGRVVDHWHAWMERFPTPAACAAATPSEVLGLWSGLGYNNRALRLRAAAEIVAADGWPETAEDLRALPGVGPYTAAAVACQAFGEQVPTVDTNHRRVLSRWVGKPLSGRPLEDVAVELLPIGFAEDWNQAVMDLASSHCRRTPDCAGCPVDEWCADPSVYTPPPRQAPYEGSRREARGKVLAAVLEGAGTVDDLVAATHLSPDRVRAALDSHEADGTLRRTDGRWRIHHP